MPSTGTSSSSSSARSSGAPSAYTEAGPPERTRAAGSRERTASRSTSCGKSPANTPQSRIRRAISCEYWPPKSRTSTSSRNGALPLPSGRSPPADRAVAGPAAASVIRDPPPRRHRGPAVGAHAHGLLALELLALRLQRRRHHHLGAVEGGNVLVAAGRHRGAQSPHEVERAVVLPGWPHQDLLQGPVLGRRDAGAARQRRMERRHAPVVAATGSLGRSGQERAA